MIQKPANPANPANPVMFSSTSLAGLAALAVTKENTQMCIGMQSGLLSQII